jgi:hypothetical protein
MFQDVIGDWPTHERFILTSCDDKYFQDFFPRFYKTYKQHWQLPIHAHIIDPSATSLQRLDKLDVTYTHCTTDKSVLRFPYSYETYCQAQRFILLGHNLLENQSVIVADVDSYALRRPNQDQKQFAQSDMAFTKYCDFFKKKEPKLMATFCNFHHSQKASAKEAAIKMQQLIEDTDTIGVDQSVIKEIFETLPYNNLKHGEWIRHYDVKTNKDLREHNQCLIYHEKGTRGKIKTVETTWTDIGL